MNEPTEPRDPLEALFAVQARDTAIDVLRHRRVVLPERAELDAVLRTGQGAHEAMIALRARRDELSRAVGALDLETRGIADKAKAVEDKLYSGTVTSPRELQDLQADLDQLRRHQAELEERELEQMEAAEQLEREVSVAEGTVASLKSDVARLQQAIVSEEASIDGALAAEEAERARLAGGVGAPLLADYERRRAQNNGHGAALLIGDTCQGCRLSIPSTEVDEIHHDTSGRTWYCDNCGAILVPR